MFHSTDLKRLERHCPLSFATPVTNREPFHVGTTAHAIIEEATNRKPVGLTELELLADKVCQVLMTKGRSFDGEPEPPLPPNQVLEGRDVALEWLINNGIPEGEAEVGLAITEDGECCTYLGELAYYGAVIDNVEIGEGGDEDMAYDVVTMTDYKSAWPTDASELDTLQRKGQAVLAWVHYGHLAQCIRQRVVNLRTNGVFEREIFLDEVGLEQLQGYWRDIKMQCDAAQRILNEGPTARAGANCIGCHHAPACPHIWDALRAGDPIDRYASAYAFLEELKPIAKEQRSDYTLPDGVGVGLKAADQRKLKEGAIHTLALAWDKDAASTVAGALTAAKISVTSAENIAKVLYPGRKNAGDRREFMDSITETFSVAKFGVWNK